MQTYDLLPGTRIDDAATFLVQHAPARADFNGIALRARYATTRPGDLAAYYSRKMDERGIIWSNSPEGKRTLAEQGARTAALQDTANRCMHAIATIDFSDPACVLRWVEDMADPVDRIGVSVDRERILSVFAANGWEPGVNCGDAFDGNDPRNFAGWIVGQWLASWYPHAPQFIAQWRERFAA